MKKHLITLAALTACAGAACAQSSVTLFGVMDVSLRNVQSDGVGSRQTMASGNNQTSRWGLRGSEDLGSGLRAGFWLESGVSADTGTNASSDLMFDRESHLFLSGNAWGELRLGRSQTPVYKIWSAADFFGQVGVGSVASLYPAATATTANPINAAFGTNDRVATSTTRNNNMLMYTLPNTLGGFVGSVFVAAGEGSTVTTAARGVKQQGFTLGYAAGPLSVMAGYATSQTQFTGSQKFKDRSLHAIYDFKVLKASIAHRQYKYLSSTENILQLGLIAPVSAQGSIKLSYGKLDNQGTVSGASIDARDVKSLGLGYQHDLSKRTALYASVGQLKNASGSAVTYSGSPSGMANGGKSTAYELGLRTSF